MLARRSKPNILIDVQGFDDVDRVEDLDYIKSISDYCLTYLEEQEACCNCTFNYRTWVHENHSCEWGSFNCRYCVQELVLYKIYKDSVKP